MSKLLFYTDYPIYSICNLEAGRFLIGGGGGSSKCGIPNVIELYQLTIDTNSNNNNNNKVNNNNNNTNNKTSLIAKLLHRKELAEEVIWNLTCHPTDPNLIACSLFTRCMFASIGNQHTIEIGEKSALEDLASVNLKKSEEGVRMKFARFTPDGKILATVTTGTKIRLWTVPNMELPNMELCGLLEGHTSEISDLCFQIDGKKAVTTSEDNKIRIWLMESFSELISLEWPQRHQTHPSNTNNTKTANNNTNNSTADSSNTRSDFICKHCRVISVPLSKSSPEFHQNLLYTTHTRLITKKRYSYLVKWDLDIGAVMASRKAGAHPVCAFEVTQDNTLLAIGNVEGQLAFYDTKNITCIKVYRPHNISITAMQFVTLSSNSSSSNNYNTTNTNNNNNNTNNNNNNNNNNTNNNNNNNNKNKKKDQLILLTASIDKTCSLTPCDFQRSSKWIYLILLPIIIIVIAVLIKLYLI